MLAANLMRQASYSSLSCSIACGLSKKLFISYRGLSYGDEYIRWGNSVFLGDLFDGRIRPSGDAVPGQFFQDIRFIQPVFMANIIQTVRRGGIQSRADLVTISGYSVVTIITNDSLDRLGLKKGGLITAEVKAPWVILQRGASEPDCSAENRFHGVVARINSGKVNTEYTVRIDDGTELCAVVSSESRRRLALRVGDRVCALFTCFAVVLHVD